MMRTMRGLAKWIMLMVALAFGGWMVFDVGMDVTGQSSGGPNDVVLRVNGQKVDRQTFSNAYRLAQDQQRQLGGPPVITLEDQRNLEDAVTEQLIQQIILQQEFKRRGITVSDGEVRQAILNVPPPELREIPQFQTDGQFDMEKYRAYLRSGLDTGLVRALEAQYRQEIPRLKLFERLTQDVHVSDAKLWRIYMDEHEQVAARILVVFPQLAVPDGAVNVTDEDLRRYYDAHRSELEQPAVAFLSFVAVSRRPVAADSADALERAGRVRQEIAGGADFAEVARRESADSVSAVNGGDLGEVSKGDFVPPFEQAALALRPGQVSQPVLSPFGYHIIRLESASGDAYHVRHVLIPIEPVGERLARVDAAADTLDLLAAEQNDPGALDAVASRLGLAVGTAPRLSQGDRVELGPSVVPDVHLWAFESQTGATSPVIEADAAYYVFRLDSLRPAGVAPLERIRDELTERVRLEKKRTRAREIADQIAAAVRGGASLEAAAQQHGLRTRELPPSSRIQPNPALRDAPQALGLAFGLPVGAVGGPVENDLALFFVEPLSRTSADREAFERQKPEMRARVIQEISQARLRMALASLRETARIVDRRAELFRVQEEDPRGYLGAPLGF